MIIAIVVVVAATVAIAMLNSLFLTTGRHSSSKYEKLTLMKLVMVHGVLVT